MALRPCKSRLAAFALATAALLAACGGSRANQTAPPSPPATRAAPEPPVRLPAYVEAFDYVWRTIHDTHWDPAKVGPAWDQARAELRPEIARAKTPDEARAVLGKLLERLGQSHFGIIPGSVYQAVPDQVASDGTPGLDVRTVNGRLTVVGVAPGSGAERARVRPGSILVRVRDRAVADLLGELGIDLAEPLLAIAVGRLLSGPIGSTIPVELDTGAATPTTVEIPLTRPRGKPAQFGHLPALYVDYQSRELARDAGLVRLSIFFDPTHVMAEFARDIAAFSGRKGLVLDLRGNPGGLGAMAMGMGGHLIDRQGASLGTMITRDSKLKFVLNPQPVRFTGKIAILVDELCMSTCEILAGGLQEIGRARVFGLRTPGAALPSQIERLPTGDGFQYAVANYVSASGTPLEGRGVVPDVTIPWDRKALLAGRDPALEAALAWIRETPRSAP
jgi:carboxyl-terminal processing protease